MNKSLKFLISFAIFSILMGILITPFFQEIGKVIGAGIILGFFAGVLSQIEGNTRKE